MSDRGGGWMNGVVSSGVRGDGFPYTDPANGISVAWAGTPRGDALDTETLGPSLVALYARHGQTFPRFLNGSYALALHDARAGRTLLARDPAGTVPLYYANSANGALRFATRIRDLLPHAETVALDPAALLDFLTFFWSVDEKTFFKGVRQVPQGSVWINGIGEQYFRFEHRPEEKTQDEWCATVRQELKQATARCLDRNLGCHLSGGVDSSVLAVLVAELTGAPPLSFIAAFPEHPAYDEAPYAQQVADAVGAELVRIIAQPRDFPAQFSAVMLAAEEPKCHPPVFPRFLLEAEAARRGIRTMVSGRGADELFTGYEWHRDDPLREHRLRRTVFDADARARLLRDDFVKSADYSPEATYDAVFSECPGDTVLERILALDFRTLLANWLVLDYKLSGRFGIAPKAPFLDRTIIELALSIPPSLKRLDGEPKALLKRAVAGSVPPDILARKKVGFRTPMGEMLRAGLEGFVRESLRPDNSVFWDVFRVEAVEEEIATHFSNRANRGWQLWALLAIREWMRVFLEERAWR